MSAEAIGFFVIVGVIAAILLATRPKDTKSLSESGPTDNREVRTIEGPGDFEFDAVGESHYQRALDSICGGKCERGHNLECDALLILEDENPHDSKAVAVAISGKIVGYLSRAHAREFRKAIAAAKIDHCVLVVKAKIVGGWDRGAGDEGHYGVKLDLPVS